MTKREKRLTQIGGVILALTIVSWIFNSYSATLSDLERELEQAQRQVDDIDIAEREVEKLAQQFDEMRGQSLPSDISTAQTAYKAWLIDLLQQDDYKFNNVKIASNAITESEDALFVRHPFQVSFAGSLDSITNMLYAFYSKQILHRVNQLSLQPLSQDELSVRMTVEAIALSDAPKTVDLEAIKSKETLSHGDAAKYAEAILNRNLFGPGNNAPTITSSTRQSFYISEDEDDRESFRLTADAKDRNQTVSYELIKHNFPNESQIEFTNDGRVRVQSDEVGEFEIQVQATDTGIPAKQSEIKSISIVFRERPPTPEPEKVEPPKPFDVAQLAVFTATVEINDRLEAWIWRREKQEMLKLTIGDPIDLGTFQGKIVSISNKALEVEHAEQGLLSVPSGKTLSEAQNLTDAVLDALETPGTESP
ncbi:MAG TPA: hypothetical protein DHW38_12925 [Planctomycetaceae bacterium]|jgi:hypothetical protein|nr:hypothetical protein [Rhodopirellula sp.]HCK72476.1 hypothetical protein [Planctomycetaceae bacterium]HCP82797.1 hypothetical protein [Planctomycetaceae bacterium]|tara:strand:- start:2565 stop:3830 length:1266 start_codon:yes stop_codon:yes gene_type:complete